MQLQVKIVETVRDFAFSILSGKNAERVLFVLTGPQPITMFNRLSTMGLFVYAPVPETDIYFVSETPIVGLVHFQPLPVGFGDGRVFGEIEESKGKPYPRKGRSRDDDDCDEDI